MRIAFIAPQPFVDFRGTPIANLRLVEILRDDGHRVDVFTFPLGIDPHCDGVRVLRCQKPPFVRSVGIGFSAAKILLDINLTLMAVKNIRSSRYDCIHGVEEGALIALLVSALTGLPFVYDMDSVLSHEISQSVLGKLPGATRLVGALERLLVRKTSLVLTISDSMAQYAKEIKDTVRVSVVPDIPLGFENGTPDPERARSQIPFTGSKFIVYTGSLAGYQGLDLLIAAMNRVSKQEPDAVLVIVGGDEKSIRRLSEQARSIGVVNKLVFLGKRQPEQVPDFLSAADVLVSPRRGGINPPGKIYTYMRAERPIVATDIPAHNTVLSDDSAILVSPTPDGIADGILKALADPDAAQKLATQARRLVRDLNPELLKHRVQEAYNLLVSEELPDSEPARKAA